MLPNHLPPTRWFWYGLALLGGFARAASGIILLDTGDPNRNTSTPGDNSGWQYEGVYGGFLGTPVAPRYFLTAAHIGYAGTFVFHGDTYTVLDTAHPDPASDLMLWQVDRDFPTYAPLFTGTGGAETGRELRVYGRGTQRGAERRLGGALRGWDWGAGDGVERWGSNVVTDLLVSGNSPYIHATFDSPGVADEAHLSVGDSGGGLFVQEDGLWKLAGINYAVDDLYTMPPDSVPIYSAVFDARGFYYREDDGTLIPIADEGVPVPTGFYSTRVAGRLAWIQSVTGVDPSELPTETYAGWSRLYFTPTQIADAGVGGPGVDPDGDGVANLLEFAFNLDPTFTESVTMAPSTGLRGLPLVKMETGAVGEERLTVEFVRRTAASGAGLTYAVQFATGLAAGDWQTGGTANVTAINARWERVKVTDEAATGAAAGRRFARVAVTLD